MNKIQLPVDKLRPGMYVAELDRPWLGLPFALEGFSIISRDQIDELGKHCKTVFVDFDRKAADNQCRRQADVKTWSRRAEDEAIGSAWLTDNDCRHLETTSVEQELSTAGKIHSALEESIGTSLDKMRREGDLDPAPLKNAVGSMTRSIERNPDAMMLLSKIRKKGRRELDRAVDTSIHMITFGRFLQFPSEQLELLGLAGLLLDIGKIYVPDTILQKQGALTAEEFSQAKTHVVQSVGHIRAALELPSGLDDIVLEHHERLDGSGYPRALRGGPFTTEAAIAGLVDSYSALTSVRPYAVQASPSRALSVLHKLRGKLFDGALVEQFIQCIGIYPVGSAVELNTGEIGIVIAQNLVRRLQPRVMVIFDSAGRPLSRQSILDLINEPKATADEPYRVRRTLPRDWVPIEAEQLLSQVSRH